MKRLILLLFLIGIALPGVARADIANMLMNDNLQDLSFIYLQDIFGVVDGVLHGSGTQIMGQMFGAFNSALLMFAGLILGYVFFVSTINTAHEGQILGKRWASMWIPIRVIAGTALVIPKASGYCTIQIMVMTIVLAGVASADKVMGAALNYLKNGGVLIQSSPPPDTTTVTLAGNILKSLTCMNGVYNIVANNATTTNVSAPQKFTPTSVNVNTATDGSSQTVYFPSADANYNNSSYQGICGTVTWTSKNESSSTATSTSTGTQGTQDLRGVAVQQIIFDLQPYAQSLADLLVPLTNASGTALIPVTQSISDITTANNLSLVFAAADYKGIMLPYFSSQANLAALAGQTIIENTAKQGWIMLGSLYFNLAQLNNNTNGSDDSAPRANFVLDSTVPGYSFINDSANSTAKYNIYCTDGANCPATVLTSTTADNLTSGSSTNSIDSNIINSTVDPSAGGAYRAGTSASFSNVSSASQGGLLLSAILSPLIGPLYAVIYNMQALFDAENQNTDPIIAVSGLGSGLVALVTMVWFGVAAAVLGVTLAVSVVPCVNPGGFGVLAFLTWFVPMFSALMIAMFVAGAMMAFYIPLIPFILFTFAALGWFATVIESMIAAPLVAIGFAVPEGHEMFGKAEASINLLASVFLRPTLMVFGFFGGAILSHVGLWLLNKGYGVAWGWAVTSNIGNLGIFGILWALLAGLIIYMSLVLAIINQTFALIHQLPDELLRWLGGGMRALGTSPGDALQAVKGDFKGATEAIGSGSQKATESVIEAKTANKDTSDAKAEFTSATDKKTPTP